MESNELQHWGVKGMRWGVRRYQNSDGTLTPAGKKRYDKEMDSLKREAKTLRNKQRTQAKLDKLEAKRKEVESLRKKDSDTESAVQSKQVNTSKKKTVKELSDDELKDKINRLELERKYRDLMKQQTPPKSTKGRDFVKDVLEKSGKNIATQFTTYVMGKGVNKVFADMFKDDSIVNPKKGQKDK